MKFTMPYGQALVIKQNKKIDEEIGINEQVEGVFYSIHWGEKKFPFYETTKAQACALCMGMQWAVYESLSINFKD
jgi:hypothetical protein